MIIRIETIAEKRELLKALKNGSLDTDKIPSMKLIFDKAAPARVLTKEEANDLIVQIEKYC